ncbi:hypothetical protein [Mycobacteroides abscessus]|uniref:hypothetical protein n=1 Tax=Mycobacteroides abscessus TaxID=36809 RepID=UPI000C263D01|nr:hypothetical protein [Mycobacteroides abscessus]
MRVIKTLKRFGLFLETDGNRFYVRHGDELIKETGSETIAEAYMELKQEELLETDPMLREREERLKQQRADVDYYAMRRETSNRAQGKANQRGGKGGRGGV